MTKKLAIRLLNRIHILPYLNLETKIVVAGSQLTVPMWGGLGMSNLDLTEPWLMPVLSTVLRLREGLFLDVGVNTGQTLIKVKSLDMQRRYVGFEPNPMCVAYVNTLIKANRFEDCSVVPVGLSDKPAVSPLLMTTDTEPDVWATVIEGFREDDFYSAKQYVSVFGLDDLVGPLGLGDLCIMKVDVEGGEPEVLVGAMGALARHRPFVLCEVLPIYDEDSKIGGLRRSRQRTMENLLEELGYSIARISHRDGRIAYLDRIETHSNLDWCDYLFVPSERRGAVDPELAQ